MVALYDRDGVPIGRAPGDAPRRGAPPSLTEDVLARARRGEVVVQGTAVLEPIVDGEGELSFVVAVEAEAEPSRAVDTSGPVRHASALLATMSHDLRTPLNAIIGFAELLRDGQVPAGTPTHTEFLDDILTSGRRLLGLIDDAIDVARIDGGIVTLHLERVSLARQIAEACASLHATLEERGVRLEVHGDPSLSRATLDAARFRRLVRSLVESALTRTHAGGHVRVATRVVDEARFVLEVEDDGTGLTREEADRLFDLRPPEGHRDDLPAPGALALPLARRIVEAHGGTIYVTSEPHAGTTFEVVLPVEAPR